MAPGDFTVTVTERRDMGRHERWRVYIDFAVDPSRVFPFRSASAWTERRAWRKGEKMLRRLLWEQSGSREVRNGAEVVG